MTNSDIITKRRARQQYRIEIVYLVIRCFSHYYMMRLFAETARAGDSDYKLAESMADVMGKIFNMEINVNELMFDMNNSANKSLDEYSQLNELLDFYFTGDRYPYSKKDIMSLLAHLYQHDIQLKMRHMFFLRFIQRVERAYGTREYGVEYLKSQSIDATIYNGMKISRMDTRIFRKEFIRIEKSLEEISNKRKNRKEKKEAIRPKL